MGRILLRPSCTRLARLACTARERPTTSRADCMAAQGLAGSASRSGPRACLLLARRLRGGGSSADHGGAQRGQWARGRRCYGGRRWRLQLTLGSVDGDRVVVDGQRRGGGKEWGMVASFGEECGATVLTRGSGGGGGVRTAVVAHAASDREGSGDGQRFRACPFYYRPLGDRRALPRLANREAACGDKAGRWAPHVCKISIFRNPRKHVSTQ
jgi:hypothetical protein